MDLPLRTSDHHHPVLVHQGDHPAVDLGTATVLQQSRHPHTANYDVNSRTGQNATPAIPSSFDTDYSVGDNDLLTRQPIALRNNNTNLQQLLDECVEATDDQLTQDDQTSQRNLHVMSDLVAQSPLPGTSQVTDNLSSSNNSVPKKRSLVKSRTCCSFFCSCAEDQNSKPIPIKRPTDKLLQRKKLFPSFSHPDTSFIFTDDDLLPIIGKSRTTSVNSNGEVVGSPATPPSSYHRRNWRRRDPDLELVWPVGGKDHLSEVRKRISVLRTYSENELQQATGEADEYTIIPVHPEISIKVRNSPDTEGANHVKLSRSMSSLSSVVSVDQLKIATSEFMLEGNPSRPEVEDTATSNNNNINQVGLAEQQPNNTPNGVVPPQSSNNNNTSDSNNTGPSDVDRGHEDVDDGSVLVAAQKYFEESGILGPITTMGNNIFRKSSKVHIIDNLQFEQIRKHSRTVQRPDKKPKNIPRSADVESGGVKSEEELSNLRELLKIRDNEIGRLRREIHKLKSVLQQTAEAPIETDLVSRIQTPVSLATMSNTNNHNNHKDDPVHPLSNPLATKKQGVSAESSDNKQQMLKDFTIVTHDKDFKSKQLIKDAILDNDFLKHLASSQIKELVESMYRKEIPKGEYVIREGTSGAHLYISDEGEFEVIKDDVILGKMGPGKAFGELAILYNCKRTASIKVLTDSKVWVLDRRVFQQIMMRTGMQRIEENITFLRSVPLLKHLTVDSLAKIADVLELEFYPTGTYIIRQDTNGDSFFLISQGNVKVTQRLPGTKIEEEIRILGRGDYFGEQALIKEDKRTANIVALSPGVECLTLDRDSFRKFIGDLSELHHINYGDKERATSFKESEREALSFSKSHNQQLLHINLNDLEVVATLGVGGFGRVELVKYCTGVAHRSTEDALETYALKCLKKQHILDTQQEEHVFNERSIMMSCESKFICRLYRTFRDHKYIYMLMEACLGGEIWTILRNRGYFDEATGQFITGCVLEAFQYLHSRGIVFRDLKPENLLLDVTGYVKLIDFGFAKYIGFSSKTWTFCGTPEYVSPEVILNKGHDRAVDYWALGILVFELLTGAPPFTSSDPMKTYNIILKNMMEFPSHLSKTSINLIKSLCRDVPAERLGYSQRGGVQEIKKHKWFQGFDWDGLSAQTMPSPIVNPVESAIDTSNFDFFPDDVDIPPDEFSGWDEDF